MMIMKFIDAMRKELTPPVSAWLEFRYMWE